jgi:integrase
VKKEEQLANPTMDKMRRTMSLVYKHGQRYGLIDCNPVKLVKQAVKSSYKPVPVTPEQVRQILTSLRQPERTLTLLIAATGLRISEACGLKWSDLDYQNSVIHVRRKHINGREGKPKTEASAASVPMHPLLAASLREWQQETPWNKPDDWVFASERLNGKGPRRANMLVADHLRPAAARAGVLSFEKTDEGEPVIRNGKLVENDPRRFGFHNLRHGLASLLVTGKITDAKTTSEILRHSDVKITLQLYTHSSNEQRVEAQGEVLRMVLGETSPVSAALN